MQELSAEGRRIVEDAAERHGVSVETVELLLSALVSGGGGQAQFNIRELGGMGQWSRGGMTMVGDMFNSGLKAQVDALCSDLAGRMGTTQVYAPSRKAQRAGQAASGGGSGNWWPEGLGRAGSSGSQNDMRYAVFPETRRLAVEQRGRVTVHDTGDHRIGGVSQQQGGEQLLSFTSQHGLVEIADMPVVTGESEGPPEKSRIVPELLAERVPEALQAPRGPAPEVRGGGGENDVFHKLERLAELHNNGVLSDDEFGAKKAELLARL